MRVMRAPPSSPEVEALARELCAMEGWDPEERIACEPQEVPLAEPCPVNGGWSCARWQAYAPAAERLASSRADAWDTF
jgi:hypothetical protein